MIAQSNIGCYNEVLIIKDPECLLKKDHLQFIALQEIFM